MVKVLLQAAAFILIMVIAYVLKKIGFFRSQDDQVLSKIMFKITLPASIVVAFSKFQPEQEMLVIVLDLAPIFFFLPSVFYLRGKSRRYKKHFSSSIFPVSTSAVSLCLLCRTF